MTDYEVSEISGAYANRIKRLEKENAELKRDKEDLIFVRNAKADHINELKEQLEQAKEIIRTFLNMPMPNNEEVFADVGAFLTKAEQFLKE